MAKNISITKKVFFLTALLFIIYIVLTLGGQVIFYGKFYMYSKQRELKNQVEEFSEEFSELTSDEDINSLLVDFSKKNDAYMLVMGEQGNILYSASYEIAVQTETGETVRLTVDNAVRDKEFTDLDIKVGDTITAEYYAIADRGKSNVYIPSRIRKNDGEWVIRDGEKNEERPKAGRTPVGGTVGTYKERSNEPNIFTEGYNILGREILYRILNQDSEAVSVSGVVTAATLPDAHNFQSSMHKAESALAAIQWIDTIDQSENIDVGENIHYVYQDRESGSKYMVCIKKIKALDEQPILIFAVNTLKSVDEAVEVMYDALPIWICVALIMVAVTALLFSKTITRPILNIMQVTNRIKKLDFTHKCDVSSEDEVGQLADNINDMSEKLDITIRELTAANQKLTDDIEHERKMELARKEFVAAVSHELKTPLAIIRAYSEGIADGISKAKQDKYLNVIISETKKMDALVLDMLENSRLEAGVQKLKIKKCDLADMTRKITARFRNGMEDKNVEFVTDIPDERVDADIDRDMLEQVMNNFITNAVRHTPDGMRIYISLAKESGGVRFSVENEGSHIDEEIIDRVWDRFYKVDKSRDRSAGGTGLGLSIAKNILVLHKAEYSVENTDVGVKFSFKLPVKK